MKENEKNSWNTDFRQSVTYQLIRDFAGQKVARVAERAANTAVQAASVAVNATNEAVQKASRAVEQAQHGRTPGAPAASAPQEKPKKQKKWKKGMPVPEGYRSVHHKSTVPIYAIGICWLLWALLLPLAKVWHFVLAAGVSVGVFFLAKKIFRGKWELEELPKPEPKAPASSGNPVIDQMVRDGTLYLRKLREANDKIEDEEISDAIDRMEDLTFKIFAYVCDHPEKAPQIRRFMNYYLPTTLKLLDSYYTLSQQGVQGQNITGAMENIRAIMHTIVLAFEKQLDSLFGDEALDISTDITVLEGMLQQEGLTGVQIPTEK